MSDNPFTGKVGLDTTDFKTAIAEMNRSIRVIESGFKAVAAGMGDWDQSSAGLEARIKALTSQIGLQQQKVGALEGEYRRVAAEKGATSKAAQDLEIRLNKENETLNKMQLELRQSNTALESMANEAKNAGTKAQELQQHEDKAVASTHSLGSALNGLKGHLASAASGMGSLALKAGKLAADLAVGMVGAAAAATAALGGFLASTITPASDLAETVSKSQVVFGKYGTWITEWGKTSASAFGMSTNSALGAASTYGNLFRSMGMTEKSSYDMSTGIVQLAADLASFNNLSPEDVLEKLRAGLTGETEPLKSLGVNISAAAVQEEALRLGLVKGNAELTAAAKAQATYSLVTKQTSLAQGDFARTSDGLANQQRIFTANLENLKATIGTALLPVINKLMGALNKLFSNPAVQAGIAALIDGIGKIAGVIFDLMAGDPGAAFDSLKEALINMLPPGVGAAVVNVLTGIWNAVSFLVSAFQEGFGFAGDAINGFINIFYKKLGETYPIFTGLADLMVWLVTVFNDASALISGLVQSLLANLQSWWAANGTGIMASVSAMWSVIQEIFNTATSVITSLFQAFTALLKGDWEGFGENLKTAWDTLWAAIQKAGEAAWAILTTWFEGVVRSIDEFFTKKDWGVIGKAIIDGIGAGIKNGWNWLTDQVKNLASSLFEAAKKALGIQSPSTAFASIGKNMALGLGIGFENSFSQISRDISAAVGGLGNISIPVGGSMVNQLVPVTAAAAPIYITIQGAPAKEMDMRKLAYFVTQEINRSPR